MQSAEEWRREMYARLSVLLTDYEGNGSDEQATAEDLYAFLVKLQNRWDDLTGE
jgi:hypothetical protein